MRVTRILVSLVAAFAWLALPAAGQDREQERIRECGVVMKEILGETHGVMVYHPSPADYWRWTHAGLEKLFTESASWASVKVTPASGTTACLGMIVSLYLDLAFKRSGLRRLARPLVAATNTLAEAIDAIIDDADLAGLEAQFLPARVVLSIARDTVLARIAAAERSGGTLHTQ